MHIRTMLKVAKLVVAILLFVFAAACTGKSVDEYYNSAKSNIDLENYKEALADFELILEKYPNSEYADEALFEIGKLYHGHAIKEIPKQESLNKAITYYANLIATYPEFPEVQKAHFMIGFIQANELNEIDNARNTYNDFINKYPESELTISAKAELQNLGVSPEEILKKNRNSED